MLLRLSDISPLPLREQIARRLREMVLSGELPAHFKLPSIRSLAKEQRVGVVTVQRAYEQTVDYLSTNLDPTPGSPVSG